MERRAALELLGLEPSEPLTHDRLRRAYLRRLRAHPPERDPEGFRRVREAFEQLEPWARMQDHILAAAEQRRQSGAPSDDAGDGEPSGPQDDVDEPAPGIVVELLEGGRVELRPATRVRPAEWTWRAHEPADVPDRAATDAASSAGPPGAASADTARSHGASGEHDASGAYDTPDEPPRPPPIRPAPAIASSPATLHDVTEEILALFQAGKPGAAIDLAERWSCSGLDDHREVSPAGAQRWALTRELLDVAPGLPDSLRRAIAHGIATGNLATACSAAETYQALNPVQANDLARHLAKRATNLHKVIGRALQSRAAFREPPPQTQRSSRAPLWAAVLVISGLVRAAGSCDHKSTTDSYRDHSPELKNYIERMPNGSAQLPFDPERDRWLLDPKLDIRQHLPPGLELGPDGRIYLRPELRLGGQSPPSRP